MLREKIIFFPQNDDEQMNFVLFANELCLKENLIKKKNISFINISNAFGIINDCNHNYNTISVNWKSHKPFYELNFLQRLLNLILNIRTTKKCKIIKGNILIIGIDGAIQRLLINHYNPGKIFCLQSMFISNFINRGKVLGGVFKIAKQLKVSHYSPGVPFRTELNGILVSKQNYKNILLKNGIHNNVYVCRMPIHNENSNKYFSIMKNFFNSSTINILYVSSAFKWHRLFKESVYQKKSIQDIIHHYKNYNNTIVKIRKHPRELSQDYEWIKKLNYPNIHVEELNNLVVDLAWCDLLITYASSVASEAKALGIPTYIYPKHFDLGFIENYAKTENITITNDLNKIEIKKKINIHKPDVESIDLPDAVDTILPLLLK